MTDKPTNVIRAEINAQVRNFDPQNINMRLYNQVSALLTQLEEGEHITLKERYMALVAIGRIQTIFVALRKEKLDEPGRGSAVRKYAKAFQAHDARGRKAASRPTPEPEPSEPDIWGDDDELGGDGAA